MRPSRTFAANADKLLAEAIRPIFEAGDIAQDKVLATNARNALVGVVTKFPDSADARFVWVVAAFLAGSPT